MGLRSSRGTLCIRRPRYEITWFLKMPFCVGPCTKNMQSNRPTNLEQERNQQAQGNCKIYMIYSMHIYTLCCEWVEHMGSSWFCHLAMSFLFFQADAKVLRTQGIAIYSHLQTENSMFFHSKMPRSISFRCSSHWVQCLFSFAFMHNQYWNESHKKRFPLLRASRAIASRGALRPDPNFADGLPDLLIRYLSVRISLSARFAGFSSGWSYQSAFYAADAIAASSKRLINPHKSMARSRMHLQVLHPLKIHVEPKRKLFKVDQPLLQTLLVF